MRYWLNISPSKTGNSFIQQFLMRQGAALKKQRIYFMRHTYLPEQPHFTMVEPIIKALRTGEIDKRALIASAPHYFNFVNPNEYSAILQMISSGIMGEPITYTPDKTLATLMAIKYLTMGHDVQIVCILRRQDKYLESFYLQKIQTGSSLTLDEYLEQINISYISWKTVIGMAADIFGADNIQIFPFETIYEGEVPFLKRFLSCFTDPEDFDYSNLDIPKNRSYSEIALRIALVANDMLAPDERKLLRSFLQKHFSNATHPRAKLLTADQSAQILRMHEADNKELFAEYCPQYDVEKLGYIA